MSQDNQLNLPVKWLVILPVTTIFVGGVMWLTEMHEMANQNKHHISELKVEFKRNKVRTYDKINKNGERLGRIEGKLDMLLQIVKEKQNK